MKRFTKFDGKLWHMDGGCAKVAAQPSPSRPRVTMSDLCPSCLELPDKDIPFLVDGFRGFGDTFYMKGPAVRLSKMYECQVYVRTPWPQVFWDSPQIKLLNPGKTNLRTQDANAKKTVAWAPEPRVPRRVSLGYDAREFDKVSIVSSMEATAKVAGKTTADDYRVRVNPDWVKPWMRQLPRPLGIIHPPSVRREQKNPARAPRPEYFQAVVNARPDVFWVSVGWLADGEEWLIGKPLKRVGLNLNHGELEIGELLALISVADVAVTGPCWMFPAALALGTPLFSIFGGYAPPRTVLNPLLQDRVAFVAPENFCACLKDEHPCDKRIGRDRVTGEFLKFMEVMCTCTKT